MKKKKSGIPRLIEISNSKKSVFIFAKIITFFVTLIKLFQLWVIYKIIEEVCISLINLNKINIIFIKNYSLMLIVSGLFYGFLRYISSLMAHKSAFDIIYNTKIALINHLNKIHLGYLNNMSLGKLEKIIMADADKMEGFLSHHQMDIIEVFLTAPLVIFYLFYIDVLLAIAMLIPIILAIIIFSINTSKPENKEDQKVLHNEIENVQTEVIEYINGMNDIKCYDIGEKSMAEYKKSIFGLSNIIIKIASVYKHIVGAFFSILNLPYLTVFILTFIRYFSNANKSTIITNFVLALISITILRSTFETFFVMARSLTEINESVKRVDDIFSIPIIEETVEHKNIERYDIEFKNVFFDYGEKEILKDINFKVPQGSKLGIIGLSGSGKTTIAKLIIKFLKVKSGEIMIGGVNINDIDSKTLMENISFVFQESYLFKDTIMFNLTMNRNISKDRVINVCKLLNIHNKIMSLKDGYETEIGKGEGFFSGGEVQRIAVARILLKDSKIIVLDEATASSDTENELYLQRAFLELAKNKTVIMIAHRLKTIESADNIIVVENGMIKESGNHIQLLNKKGRYYELLNYQELSEKMTISNINEKGGSLC